MYRNDGLLPGESGCYGAAVVSFHVEKKLFERTLRKAIAESSRTAPEVVNGHALAVVMSAVKLTKKAEAQRIAYILGRIGTKLTYGKKGQVVKSKSKTMLIAEDSLAARIINKRRRDFAGPDYQLWGNALEQAARKLIAARMRSTAFIKSGWLWAQHDLWAVVKERPPTKSREAKAVGRRKGGASAARTMWGDKASCIVFNTALIASGGKYQSKGKHNPLPVAEQGLALALAAERVQMENYLAKKFGEAMKKAGAM